jgi:hypothetical protein
VIRFFRALTLASPPAERVRLMGGLTKSEEAGKRSLSRRKMNCYSVKSLLRLKLPPSVHIGPRAEFQLFPSPLHFLHLVIAFNFSIAGRAHLIGILS